MKLKQLQKTLDDIRHQNGVEYWFARELATVLGYLRWENFEAAMSRARQSCEKTGLSVADHFREVTKMVDIGSRAQKPVNDYKLTRYACYLVALNGDPKKEEIAFAQAYFVSQTRTLEVLAKKVSELERMDARERLRLTESAFSGLMLGRGVDAKGVSRIRSAGDSALFGGKSTDDMKRRLAVPKKEPLADFLPDVTLKAKDLAAAMTVENTRRENLHGEEHIKRSHSSNNQHVRGALVKSGIHPESLPASEDIKKVQSRHRKETKELQARQKTEMRAAIKRAKKKSA